MLDPLIGSTTIPLLERVALFGEARQQVLAGNIANIDTPGYRMRDLPVEEFQEALRTALAQRRAQPAALGGSLAELATLQKPARTMRELFPKELFRAADNPPQSLTFHDAAHRDIETEVARLTKNFLMQNVAVELMAAQFNQLQAVISERA